MKSVADSDYEVPDAMKPILRDYQKTGYRWLCTIAQLGFGGILADDMGLGDFADHHTIGTCQT